TSTNLLVDDMARLAGQPRFGIFEITPVGIPMAIVGGIYLYLVSGRLLGGRHETRERKGDPGPIDDGRINTALIGDAGLFSEERPFQPGKAIVALATFVGAIALATFNVAPI